MFLLVSVRHVGAHPYELQHGVSIQRSINLGKTVPRVSRIRFTPSTQMLGRVFVYLPPFIYQILELICRMVLDGVRLKTRSGLKTTLVKFTYHKGYTGRFPHCSINILSWSRLILMSSSYNCYTSQSPFDTFWLPFASECPYAVSCSETVCPYLRQHLRYEENFALRWGYQYSSRNLQKAWFATCKGMRCRNREIFACGIRITWNVCLWNLQSWALFRNTAQGIQNLSNDRNP